MKAVDVDKDVNEMINQNKREAAEREQLSEDYEKKKMTAKDKDEKEKLRKDYEKKRAEILERQRKEAMSSANDAKQKQIAENHINLRWKIIDRIVRSVLWCMGVVFLAIFLTGVADFFKSPSLSDSCMVLFIVTVLYVAFYIGGSVYLSIREAREHEQSLLSTELPKIYLPNQPAQENSHFLTTRNLPYFLLPFGFICLVVQVRLLVRIRRVIAEYLP
jgi:hypothetical protein